MKIETRKIQLLLLLLLVTTAIFLRFYKIRDYMVFLGDEGRDMMVMRQMVLERRPTFLGPTASVAGFYLGPIYYWMATPFLVLSKFDPVGPSYMVAIFGLATILLLYKFLKETVGFWPAFIVSFLYTTAPLITRYSRSSWNPNPLPFFALLLIYCAYKGIRLKKARYFFFAGLCLGVVVQLHYLASILLAILGLIIVLNTKPKTWVTAGLGTFLGFLITFSPFLLFELRHDFPNFRTILEFVTRGTTVGFKSQDPFYLLSNINNIFFNEITGLRGTIFTKIPFWVLTVGGVMGLVKSWQDVNKRTIYSIGLIWFLGGLAGIRFYAGQVFDYYFGFMFPAPFFLAGLVIYIFWHNNLAKVITIFITVMASLWFLENGFYRSLPNRLIDQTARVADFVIEKSQGQSFNFGLIAGYNSDHAYRYFLEIKNHKPTELETLVTDQLLVVCEDKKCAPLGHPSWEIAGFGRGEIAGEWELTNIGIKVFRLTHWPGAPNPAGKPAVKGI